ncbi:unnamed protein product [Acanthoscelides obtectus]|uniref:Uncharacterized protein n=1 Tax=Acanthoscelides obtectus TaxID=200917 RepID=A0A9P0VTZ9_ACAOB|nr:unnamed protein product [Acanthoscelides obtectus]CAK1683822.1 hypothetical protein AOBTE_LOCUS34479 [Acanthoscelides obtectus]
MNYGIFKVKNVDKNYLDYWEMSTLGFYVRVSVGQYIKDENTSALLAQQGCLIPGLTPVANPVVIFGSSSPGNSDPVSSDPAGSDPGISNPGSSDPGSM